MVYFLDSLLTMRFMHKKIQKALIDQAYTWYVNSKLGLVTGSSSFCCSTLNYFALKQNSLYLSLAGCTNIQREHHACVCEEIS